MPLAGCLPQSPAAGAPTPGFWATTAELRKVLDELEANVGHRSSVKSRLREVAELQRLLEGRVRAGSAGEAEPSLVA